jgi:hypothetical protein
MIRYLFQIGSLYVIPIAYGSLILTATIIMHLASDQVAWISLSMEFVYLTSMLWFVFMSDSLANPIIPNAGIGRDILAYSELAKVLCKSKSSSSVRFAYAATRRIQRSLRDRGMRSRLLQVVSDRLRSMLMLRSIDYDLLSDLSEGLHCFPEMKRVRETLLRFIYNPENRWLDDFEYVGPAGHRSLSGLPQYVITAAGTVIAFLALFVPDVRLTLVNWLGLLGQTAILEKVLDAVAVLIFVGILLGVTIYSGPRLSWSLIHKIEEEAKPAQNDM